MDVAANVVASRKRQQSGPSEGGERAPDEGGGEAQAMGFTTAAYRIIRKTDYDESRTLSATQRQLRSISVPTVGYLRAIVLKVTASGGDGSTTNAVAVEDAPWSVIREAIFRDVNGAPLATLSGFQLYAAANKYHGYTWRQDPRQNPAFADVDTDGDFTFLLRIPAEIIQREAYGALANQNASSPYRVELALAPSTDVYSTDPAPTLPDVRVQAYVEAWSQPPAVDPLTGQPVQRTPNHLDTTQVFSREIKEDVASGEQTVQLEHIGNWIRGLTFICEDSNGDRSDSVFPDESTLWLDDRQLFVLDKDYWRNLMVEQFGYNGADEAENGLDTGVFHLSFADDLDGHPGAETRGSYLLTTPATSLRLTGSFGATMDKLTVIYNQILPPEAAPSGRISGGS